MMEPREKDKKSQANSSLFDVLVETNEANRSNKDESLLGVLRRVRRENDAKRKRTNRAKRLADAV